METVEHRKQRNRAVFATINGVEHKLCSGPLHREGKFVPVTNFFIRKDNRLRPWCMGCESARRGYERMVPYDRIKFAVHELVFRLGKAETARRIGIKYSTLWCWLKGDRKYVHRETARQIIYALTIARQKNEARDRRSIRHGAKMRGREERVPIRNSDFNGPNQHEASRAKKRRNQDKMIIKGHFLCGCDPNDEKLKHYQCTLDPATNQLSFKRYDSAGYEVCPIHGKRLYGWASTLVQGLQGNEVIDHHAEYVRIYGHKVADVKSNMEDRRDNRDPSKVGSALLAQRSRGKVKAKTKKAESNGHVL